MLIATTTVAVAGCGWFGDEPDETTQAVPIRTAYPTFTPTPVQAAAQPSSTPVPGDAPATAVEAVPAEALTAFDEQPLAVVNAPSVNIREQPSVESGILGTVERGAEFDIVGRNVLNTWWNICCVDGKNGWIIGEYVDTDGALDAVAVTDGSLPAVADASQSADGATAPTSAGGPTDGASFGLVSQEQFPESKTVRVYAYVYAGSEALEGFSLRVTHDGRPLPVADRSFGGQPAFTWPFQDARQRYQNLKVEFPDELASGVWIIELLDAQGKTVGPAAQFTLAENDPNRELYVRYERV